MVTNSLLIFVLVIAGTVFLSELADGIPAVSHRKRPRLHKPQGPQPTLNRNRGHNNEEDVEVEGHGKIIPTKDSETSGDSDKNTKTTNEDESEISENLISICEGFKYDVYISYRTSSKHLAMLLYVLFERENVTAYLDVEDLYGGPRDEQLFNGIRESPNFILVLGPGSMDKAIDETDFMHQEIKNAINLDRRIIIVYDRYDFPAPSQFSKEIQAALRFQGIPWQHTLVDQSLARILSYFKTPKKLTSSHKHKLSPLHI